MNDEQSLAEEIAEYLFERTNFDMTRCRAMAIILIEMVKARLI